METETTTTDPATAPETAPATSNPWEGFTWDGNVDSLPVDVAKAMRDARADAGRARTQAKATAAQEARDALIKELSATAGLGTAEDPPDAAKLAEHLQKAKADAASAQVELRVFQLASELGADAKGLLDSRSFCDAIDAIEADDWADFDVKASELIKQRATAHTLRQAVGHVGRLPVESLKPGALPSVPEQTLADQIAAAERAGNVRESIRLKSELAARNHK